MITILNVFQLSEMREAFDCELHALRDSNNSSAASAQQDLKRALEEQSNAEATCLVLRDEKRTLENQLIAKEAANQQLSQAIEELYVL